jgi:hypothetical protein
MSTSPAVIRHASWTGAGCARRRSAANDSWWGQYREASFNWLALGLLLAAWNASDNDAAVPVQPRPEAFRGYTYISVRAATLHPEEVRTASMNR